MTKTIIVSCLAFSLAVFSVIADDEIIVTGTRMNVAKNELPIATTVLTKQDIQERQALSLPDLLQGLIGMNVTMSGGYGKLSSIFLRGTESDHVVVLIDGMRIGSATSGLATLEHIPVSQIERIEIVRGPRSSIWGSDAIGGVIHLFTRRSMPEQPLSYSIDLAGGSYHTLSLTAGLNGRIEDEFDYHMAVSSFESQNIDARTPTPGPFGVDQTDEDGYDNLSYHVGGRWQFAENAYAELFGLRVDGTTEFDGSFQDRSDILQQVISGAIYFQLLEKWNMQFRLGSVSDQSKNFTPGLTNTVASRFETERLQFSWQNDLDLANNIHLTLGLDYQDDEIMSATSYDQTQRDHFGIFAQYQMYLAKHKLIASIRHDDYDGFGQENTEGLAWRYHWSDRFYAYMSYASAYKIPSFNELFFPGFGNPNLKAESAKSYEIGIGGAYHVLDWQIQAYHTNIEDLIATVCDIHFNCMPENINHARIQGAEFEFSVKRNDWHSRLNLEYLRPIDRDTHLRLPRRVQQRLIFDLGRDFIKHSLAGRLLVEGDRFDNVANTRKVGGYATVDLLGTYRLSKRLKIQAKLANLLDKQYQTIDTYPSFGRNFFVSIHYHNNI